MFEHLDDPAAHGPGEGERAKVRRRADVLRRRRQLTMAASACLVVLAGSVSYLVTRPSAVGLASSETAYQFNALQGPLPVGTPVPATALVNVDFVGSQDGFALAAHRGQVLLAETRDGGNSWKVQNDHLPSGYGENGGYEGEFEFVGSSGYLWGGSPGPDGAARLWVTHDGGSTWRAAPIGPLVYDVSAIGADVWALSASCAPVTSGTAPSPPCPAVLEQSLDSGASWHAVGLAGFTNVIGTAPLDQRVELARITPSRAYVLSVQGVVQAGSAIGLVYTDDSGLTWSARPVPCSGTFDLGAEMAASGTDDLWLLCGSEASAGSQPKELYRSSDGGLTWALASSASMSDSPAPATSGTDPLPSEGYVAPFSIGHKNLAVASPTTAWLYPSRAAMYKTVTGGHSWSVVPGLDTAGFGSGGAGNVTFISATEGWICTYGVGLWHTTDGVHWSPLGV